jgi:hypothetical protein
MVMIVTSVDTEAPVKEAPVLPAPPPPREKPGQQDTPFEYPDPDSEPQPLPLPEPGKRWETCRASLKMPAFRGG